MIISFSHPFFSSFFSSPPSNGMAQSSKVQMKIWLAFGMEALSKLFKNTNLPSILFTFRVCDYYYFFFFFFRETKSKSHHSSGSRISLCRKRRMELEMDKTFFGLKRQCWGILVDGGICPRTGLFLFLSLSRFLSAYL